MKKSFYRVDESDQIDQILGKEVYFGNSEQEIFSCREKNNAGILIKCNEKFEIQLKGGLVGCFNCIALVNDD
jgi:hypothetical protein